MSGIQLKLPENVKISLMLLGAVQAIKLAISLFSRLRSYSLPSIRKSLPDDGQRQKWAFILNSTSPFGCLACEFLAGRNYNLILASFEAERLDLLKAELFLRFPTIELREYYFYKGDMKNFEEKFHFREFLEKFEVEVLVLNDCVGEPQRGKKIEEFGYEELQFELSKKFLLKGFLFKIVVENLRRKPRKREKTVVVNVNEGKEEDLLGFRGFEEFLKGLVEGRHGKELNVEVVNMNSDARSEFESNEKYKEYLRARFFS